MMSAPVSHNFGMPPTAMLFTPMEIAREVTAGLEEHEEHDREDEADDEIDVRPLVEKLEKIADLYWNVNVFPVANAAALDRANNALKRKLEVVKASLQVLRTTMFDELDLYIQRRDPDLAGRYRTAITEAKAKLVELRAALSFLLEEDDEDAEQMFRLPPDTSEYPATSSSPCDLDLDLP